MKRHTRAQSEPVGVVLLVALVVLSVSTFGVFYLGDVVTESAPTTNVDGRLTTERITLVHDGGDVLASDDIRLVVRVDGTATSIDWGDDPSVGSQFGPGERWSVDVAAVRESATEFDPEETVTVSLVHEPSRTTVFEQTVDPQIVPSGSSASTPVTAHTPASTETSTLTATSTATSTATTTTTPASPSRDATAPTVLSVDVVDDESDRGRWRSRAELTVRVEATDDRALAGVSVELRRLSLVFGTTADRDSARVSGTRTTIELRLAESTPSLHRFYSLTVTATDAAGNRHTETIVVTV